MSQFKKKDVRERKKKAVTVSVKIVTALNE